MKILLRRTLLVVVLTGFALFPALLFYFISKSSNPPLDRQVQSDVPPLSTNITTFYEQEQSRFGLPTRLKIPSINVNAPVEYVGLTQDGAMDVPQERANVAWFNLGQRPGENGSAVIAGHYGWENMEESVFDDLHKLRKGDKLYIEDEKGEVITFVVRESRRYDPDADASEVFGSSDGKAHLNLVTCEGVWDKVSKTYSKRLVVFADKE